MNVGNDYVMLNFLITLPDVRKTRPRVEDPRGRKVVKLVETRKSQFPSPAVGGLSGLHRPWINM
jgi:hypothetical protein